MQHDSGHNNVTPYEAWIRGLDCPTIREAIRHLNLVRQHADASGGLVTWRFSPLLYSAVRAFGKLPATKIDGGHAV